MLIFCKQNLWRFPARFARGVKERKTPAEGSFYSFQAVGRGAARLKHGGNFELCGARLKKLFEKSFLRIFKSFPAAVVFY